MPKPVFVLCMSILLGGCTSVGEDDFELLPSDLSEERKGAFADVPNRDCDGQEFGPDQYHIWFKGSLFRANLTENTMRVESIGPDLQNWTNVSLSAGAAGMTVKSSGPNATGKIWNLPTSVEEGLPASLLFTDVELGKCQVIHYCRDDNGPSENKFYMFSPRDHEGDVHGNQKYSVEADLLQIC